MSSLHNIYSIENDELISDICFKNSSLNKSYLSILKNHDLLDYVKNRYDDSESLVESLWRIKSHIEIRPVCPVCGRPVRFDPSHKNCRNRNGNLFLTYCSPKCQANDKELRNRVKEHNLLKYGVDNPAKSDIVKNKIKAHFNDIYGVDNPYQSNEIKEKIKNIKQEKYNDDKYTNREKAKETCLSKYGVNTYTKSNNFKELFKDDGWIKDNILKSYNTKKKNNSFNISKPEDELYSILISYYPDTIRQYNSLLYPFNCDFYIPSKDLYIEYNGTWTHGDHPFDSTNIEDIKKLNKWKEKSLISKFYKNAIYTWTDLDVRKRNTAKENNLNYLEIWNLNNIDDIFKKIESLKN